LAVSGKNTRFHFCKSFLPGGACGAGTHRKRKFFWAEKANAGDIFCNFGCGLSKIKRKTGILSRKIKEIKYVTTNKTNKQKKK